MASPNVNNVDTKEEREEENKITKNSSMSHDVAILKYFK